MARWDSPSVSAGLRRKISALTVELEQALEACDLFEAKMCEAVHDRDEAEAEAHDLHQATKLAIKRGLTQANVDRLEADLDCAKRRVTRAERERDAKNTT